MPRALSCGERDVGGIGPCREGLRAIGAAKDGRLRFGAGKVEEIDDLVMDGQETLRLPGGFEPLHDPLSSSRGLM